MGHRFSRCRKKKLAEKNGIEIYSICSGVNSVIAEGFIRTLKNKTYKHMSSVSKNVYINKLDDIVNKYNNTYHSTIKMLNLKFVILLEYRNIKYFCKRLHSKLVLKFFVIKKVKNTVPWGYIINDLNGEEVVGRFYKDKLQKPFRI